MGSPIRDDGVSHVILRRLANIQNSSLEASVAPRAGSSVIFEIIRMRLFYLQLRSFCLRFVFFTYGGGTVSKIDQTQFPEGGEP